MRQSRLPARWLIVVAALCLAAACGRGKEEKVIIMGPSGQFDSIIPVYSEAGGVGGRSAQVSGGEFATVLERRTVGSDPPGARPGEWLKIRTVINPREGWIHVWPSGSKDQTLPRPEPTSYVWPILRALVSR